MTITELALTRVVERSRWVDGHHLFKPAFRLSVSSWLYKKRSKKESLVVPCSWTSSGQNISTRSNLTVQVGRVRHCVQSMFSHGGAAKHGSCRYGHRIERNISSTCTSSWTCVRVTGGPPANTVSKAKATSYQKRLEAWVVVVAILHVKHFYSLWNLPFH